MKIKLRLSKRFSWLAPSRRYIGTGLAVLILIALIFINVGLTQSDAVRGASEACDQNVCLYIAGANERSNEEMRRLRKSYGNFWQSHEVINSYHQSLWNEYAPEIERAIQNQKSLRPVPLQHIYGIVLPHHIPTIIPRLTEFYSRLKLNRKVKNFIVIGPDHTDAGRAPVTISNESFFTKYGEVKPIQGFARKLQSERMALIDETPFDREHSVGAQIILISAIFPGARVAPIILRYDASAAEAQALGRKLSEYVDDETVLVASVDFSHYLSSKQAGPIDKISGEVIRDLNLEALSLIKADSNKSMAVFIEAMRSKKAIATEDLVVLNTNDFMQNSDYTTGYVFGYWGVR